MAEPPFDPTADASRIQVAARSSRWLAKCAGDVVARPLAGDLHAVYLLVHDDEDADPRPLRPDEQARLGLDDPHLHVLAVRNLIAALQPIERDGEDGAFSLSEPGEHEDGLLFVPSVWKWVGQWLHGDPVVALPSPDVLLVTGTQDPNGVYRVRAAADAVIADAEPEDAHFASSCLIVRRDGRWHEFEDTQNS